MGDDRQDVGRWGRCRKMGDDVGRCWKMWKDVEDVGHWLFAIVAVIVVVVPTL